MLSDGTRKNSTLAEGEKNGKKGNTAGNKTMLTNTFFAPFGGANGALASDLLPLPTPVHNAINEHNDDGAGRTILAAHHAFRAALHLQMTKHSI